MGSTEGLLRLRWCVQLYIRSTHVSRSATSYVRKVLDQLFCIRIAHRDKNYLRTSCVVVLDQVILVAVWNPAWSRKQTSWTPLARSIIGSGNTRSSMKPAWSREQTSWTLLVRSIGSAIIAEEYDTRVGCVNKKILSSTRVVVWDQQKAVVTGSAHFACVYRREWPAISWLAIFLKDRSKEGGHTT